MLARIFLRPRQMCGSVVALESSVVVSASSASHVVSAAMLGLGLLVMRLAYRRRHAMAIEPHGRRQLPR